MDPTLIIFGIRALIRLAREVISRRRGTA